MLLTPRGTQHCGIFTRRIFTRILALLHVDQSGPAEGRTRIWRSDLKAELSAGLVEGNSYGNNEKAVKACRFI